MDFDKRKLKIILKMSAILYETQILYKMSINVPAHARKNVRILGVMRACARTSDDHVIKFSS